MKTAYRVEITEPAQEDIVSVLDYIEYTLFNPKAADNLFDLTYSQLMSLSSMPYRHPLVNDSVLAQLGIRQLIINNYLAFFYISDDDNTVYILRFMYSGRNWTEILKLDSIP